MKRAFLVALVSIMMLMGFAPNVFRVSAASGLADTINSVANGVNWSDGNFGIQHAGYVFSRLASPHYVLTYPYTDPAFSLAAARLSEVDGTGSPTSYVSASWPRASGADQLPAAGGSDWLVYYRWAYHLYDWFPASWSRGTALTQFRAAVAGSPMLDYPARTLGSGRYYDEYIETADIYLGLGSVSDAVSTFQEDYDTHWNGAYWGYTGMSGIETEAGPFAMIAAKIYVANGNSLANFASVPADLVYKFLQSGWGSPLWAGSYVCTHFCDNRLRLENTMATWAALQTYWTYFTPAQQATMVGMLTGNGGTTAWQHLMASALYVPSVNKFIMLTNDSPVSGTPLDVWTAVGLNALFFMGIVPDTGSLAVPLNEEFYEDTYTITPATNFGFNYNNKQIKIPVRAGTLHFLFGTTESSASFPSDGIYTVQFSTDWNTVQSVNRVSGLSSNFKYLPPAGGSPPPTTGTISVSSTYNTTPIGGVSVTVSGPTSTAVTTSASGPVSTGQLSFGSYTLTASYNGQPLVEGATISSSSPSASVNFPFTSVVNPTGTIRVYAEYGGQNIAVQVTGTGPNGWSQTGTTSITSTPLTYTSVPASTTQYQFSGTCNKVTKTASVTVTNGGSVDAILDFGGGDWIQWLIHNPIVIVVGVAAVGIIGGGTAIGLRQTMPQPKPRKGRRRR